MKRRDSIIFLTVVAVLVSVLLVWGLHGNLTDLVTQCLGPGLQMGKPPVSSSYEKGVRSGMLLMMGAVALMAGGVLWSLVNYKEKQ